jgi:hypothetical protein
MIGIAARTGCSLYLLNVTPPLGGVGEKKFRTLRILQHTPIIISIIL